MAQVKEFVSVVLNEIETLLQTGDEKKREEGLDALLLCESDEFWAALKKRLNANKENDNEISERSLAPFIDLLAIRYNVIKHTDGIYTHRPNSTANVASLVLAEHLASALQKDSSFYYLFPGIDLTSFVSSRGKFTELKLSEFFLTMDDTPVELRHSLDQYRENMQTGPATFPPHVCIPPHVAKGSRTMSQAKKLTRQDALLLTTHSSEAEQYLKAINSLPDISDEELDKKRTALVGKIQSTDYIPAYTYNTYGEDCSSKNLIANGFLREMHVTNASTFASFLSGKIDISRWRDVVDVIGDDLLDSLMLPVMNGAADDSVLQSGKFQKFIDDQVWQLDQDTDLYNRAMLYLLTETYIRKRSKEGAYIGAIGQMTGLVGYNRQAKEGAAVVFQSFLMTGKFYLNQLESWLQREDKLVQLNALRSDRLAFLTEKAGKLGLDTRQSQQSLAAIASALSKMNPSSWAEAVKKIDNNILQQYISANGGFNACVKTRDHYKKGNEQYNKAILYILAEAYFRKRSSGSDYHSLFGRAYYPKVDKVTAVEVFKEFLASEYPLNQLSEYLKDGRKQHLEKPLRDSYSPTSELGTLVAQAERVCEEEYFEQRQNGSMLKSLFGYAGKV